MLTDLKAINQRGWQTNLLNNRSELELNELEKRSLAISRGQIKSYENDVMQRGGVPFQVQPRSGFQTLERYNKILTGEINPYPEDVVNTLRMREDSIGTLHMANIFGKTPDEILTDLPAYQSRLMEAHGKDHFGTALKVDIEKRINSFEQFNRINRHAQESAARGDSMSDSISDFMELEEGDIIDEKIVEQYVQSYNGSQQIFDDNRKEFEKFTKSLEKAIEDVEVFLPVDFFTALNLLAEMPNETRVSALIFADQNLGAEGSFKRLFESRQAQIFRGFVNLSPRELIGENRKKIEDIEKGKKLFVPRFKGDKLERRSDAIGAALRLASTEREGIATTLNPWLREATDEEKIQRIKDSQQAANMGKAMLDIEGLLQEKLSDTSSIDNAAMRWVADNITYPFATISADVVNLVGEITIGSKAAAALKIGTTGKRAIAGLIAYKSSEAAIKREHFNELVQKHPDMDGGTAYDLSSVSGGIAAIPDALASLFVISKMPGVRNVISGFKQPSFISNWVSKTGAAGRLQAFALETTSVLAVETFSEVVQSLTLDMTQDIWSAFDQDVPEVNLSEQFFERWKEAPDIALAMLPLALLGGAGASFVSPSAADNYLSNRNMLEFAGLDSASIDDIIAEQTIGTKIEKFQAAIDPETMAANVEAKIVAGATVADVTNPAFQAPMNAARDSMIAGTRDDPVMVANRDEQGNITTYSVQLPDAMAETYTDITQARQRVEQWYDENGLAPIEEPAKAPPARARPAQITPEQAVEEGAKPITRAKRSSLKAAIARNQEISEEEKTALGDIVDQAETVADLVPAQRALSRQRVEQIIEAAPDLTEEQQTELRDLVETGEFATPFQLSSALSQLAKSFEVTEEAAVPPAEQPIKVPKGAEKVVTVDEKGETVEKVKPAVKREEDQTLTPDTSTVGIKNAKTTEVLKRFGANLPHKTRVRFADTLEQAQQEEGLVDNALTLAQRIVDDPDVSSPKEQASMLIRLNDILNQIDTLETKLVDALELGDKPNVKILETDIKAREAEAILLSTASQLTGTEIGRSLSFRQILLDRQTGNIVRIKRAAKRAGKGKISKAIEKKLESAALELEKALVKIEKLAKANADLLDNSQKADAQSAMTQAIKKRSRRGKATAAKRRKDARAQLTKMGYC